MTYNVFGGTLNLAKSKCSASRGSVCVRQWWETCLTLLVGSQEEHPARKNWVMGYWRGYLSIWSVVHMICIQSSWCHCHPIISCSTCFSKIQNGLPFWCRLTLVVLEKRPYVCMYVVDDVVYGCINMWQAESWADGHGEKVAEKVGHYAKKVINIQQIDLFRFDSSIN